LRKKEIEESKFLGGDMEHTHLVKGLDYALLNKIRSELEREKRQETEEKGEVPAKEDTSHKPTFRTPLAQSVHHLLFEQNEFMIKHRLELGRENGKIRSVDRFLRGRTTFVFDMTDLSAELPTTLLRSKEDCAKVEERIMTGINEDVLKRVSKLMAQLKPRKKSEKKSKKAKEKKEGPQGGHSMEAEQSLKKDVGPDLSDLMSLGFLKPENKEASTQKPTNEDLIFPDAGDYVCLPSALQLEEAREKKLAALETRKRADAEEQLDAEERELLKELTRNQTEQASNREPNSLHEREKTFKEEHSQKSNYFDNVKDYGEEEEEETYVPKIKIKGLPAGAKRPTDEGDDTNEVEMEIENEERRKESSGPAPQAPEHAAVPPGPLEDSAVGPQLPYSESTAYPSTSVYPESAYYPQPYGGQEAWAYPDTDFQYETTEKTKKPASDMAMVATKQLSEQEMKDRGLATVFRRDDNVLKRKTTDKREMDPSFVSENYTECYPGTYESTFSTAVVEEGDSDEDDLSKMDMGTRARKRIKPWHFESDAAWNKFNDTMEATPKAAFQFGVKMSGGRKKDLKKDPKKSKEAKLNRELQQINNILRKKKTADT